MAQAERAQGVADETKAVDIDFLLGLTPDEDENHATYRIGDLAREFDVTLRTLRFYEDRGLLSPERRGTTRFYDRKDRARLRLVLLAKILGFSLTEARQMIDLYDQPEGRRRQLELALERLQEQQVILQDQRRELEQSILAMDRTIEIVREKLACDGKTD